MSEEKNAPKQSVFGIDENTKTAAPSPIPAPKPLLDANSNVIGYELPLCKMTGEVVAHDVDTRDGGTVFALDFPMATVDEGSRTTVRLFEFDPEDESTDKQGRTKGNLFNEKVRHLYELFEPLPATGLGKGAKDVKEYLQMIAHAFNTNGKDGTAVFANALFWMKFVYYKGNLVLPYAPPFAQRYSKDKKCTIQVNPKYDKISADSGGDGNSASGLSSFTSLPGGPQL